ncbi:Hypothetical predicted protein [Mytilus galloprovincialis]|uniref:Uncharacterized protein n=1 Tax=Mytilus galloprovincialis TaxID=29158 RepID=A0A8B6GHG1_MYTGA|nr:Hypothetical predicted protein [Mytilus galloprovincialis]
MSEKVCTDNRLALYIAENKFRKACEQIKLITRRLNLLQIRYDKAKRDDMKSFRYTLRLQLATTEGARNMFYEYAVKQATQVGRLKREIKTQQLPKVEQECHVNDRLNRGDASVYLLVSHLFPATGNVHRCQSTLFANFMTEPEDDKE